LVFFIHPNSIIPNQNVNDKGRVTVRWEVIENTCGYSARKFISRIARKAVMIINSVLFSFLFRVKLTSFLKFPMVDRIVFPIGFLTSHHFFLMINGRMKISIHVIENMEDLGSKTENRFVIILWFF
jgi:hypothetical protein